MTSFSPSAPPFTPLLPLDCTAAGNMVKPFVDPATHKKIRFLPNDLDRLRAGRASNLQAVLRETMPEELLNWWVGSY